MRKGFTATEDGLIKVPIENIWERVVRWAKRNGYKHVPSYGIEGVAPT